MAYTFADTTLRGDLGLGNEIPAYPLTMGCWIKAHPAVAQHLTGTKSVWDATRNSSHYIASDAPANVWDGITLDTSVAFVSATYNPNSTWTPAVYVCRSATDRQLYVGDQASSVGATSKTVDNQRYFAIGGNAFSTAWSGLIAEVAYWDSALSSTDVTAFLSGTRAADISSASLIGYYPLKVNGSYLADESGNAGPTLTIIGTDPTYSADHPPVTSSLPQVVTEPLYYGETRLANKTGLLWKVTQGQSDLAGTVYGSGTAGTTNGSGVFSAQVSTGTVATPVFLHLYWEEGSDPVVDRSLIVKTTLVAEA